ncbi:hypothetical protein TNCV_3949071 [Trichonephila clavipes]|nr:hypothetical protein TNCV_3949071 [Trichonephila clavipes]
MVASHRLSILSTRLTNSSCGKSAVSAVGCSLEDNLCLKRRAHSTFQYDAFIDDNSRTTVMVSFRDVTRMKPCPDFFPNQLALRIACGTEMTFILTENTTPMMKCPVYAPYFTLNGTADD